MSVLDDKKIGPAGQEIGEKLVWKFEETLEVTKPIRSQIFNMISLLNLSKFQRIELYQLSYYFYAMKTRNWTEVKE